MHDCVGHLFIVQKSEESCETFPVRPLLVKDGIEHCQFLLEFFRPP